MKGDLRRGFLVQIVTIPTIAALAKTSAAGAGTSVSILLNNAAMALPWPTHWIFDPLP
ncbi:hypothetical protein [Pseudooceanicola sp.]|uniref:hypothetical protein n=1 Tax=Pseudooceanicola sp. TaxID=1914328 RepID=UPI003512E3E4